ncbi:unnamed protein product, partial [Amoebophrya sp. A120]
SRLSTNATGSSLPDHSPTTSNGCTSLREWRESLDKRCQILIDSIDADLRFYSDKA